MLQFRLSFCDFSLINTYLFLDTTESMTEVVADSLTLASPATSAALSAEITTITC